MTGALCCLSGGLIVDCIDMPVVDGQVSGLVIADWLSGWCVDVAVVERVHSMPRQGVASTFKFGQAYGTVLGAFGALRVPIVSVTPQRWKKDYGIGSDKEAGRLLACDLWPDDAARFKRKKDHGRAESALLARWWSVFGS